MIQATLAALLLFGSLIFINIAQTLSLIIRPFSGHLFRRFNCFLAGTWWGWCVRLSRLAGIDVQIKGDPIPYGENAIVFANHQSATDIVMLMFLAFEKGRIGDLKWFVKDALKYVPGVGWGMLFLDCLFVKRAWLQDHLSIKKTFDKIVSLQLPLWLITFPEGTRATPEKLKKSRDYAIKTSRQVFNRVLIPRKRGFVATLEGLRFHATSVYDVTIVYPGTPPTLWEYMQGKARRIDIFVTRFDIKSLPEDSKALGEWLVQRFAEKDQFLSAKL